MCLVDPTLIRRKRRDQTVKNARFRFVFHSFRFVFSSSSSLPRPNRGAGGLLLAPLDPANHHAARRLPRTRALLFLASFLPSGIRIWGLLSVRPNKEEDEARRGEGDGLHWPPRRRHAAALQVQRRRPLARRQVHPPALLVTIRQHLPAMVPVSVLPSLPLSPSLPL